jgi:hypothetical protein
MLDGSVGLHLVVELRRDATKANDELVVQQYIRLCGLVKIRLLKVKQKFGSRHVNLMSISRSFTSLSKPSYHAMFSQISG